MSDTHNTPQFRLPSINHMDSANPRNHVRQVDHRNESLNPRSGSLLLTSPASFTHSSTMHESMSGTSPRPSGRKASISPRPNRHSPPLHSTYYSKIHDNTQTNPSSGPTHGKTSPLTITSLMSDHPTHGQSTSSQVATSRPQLRPRSRSRSSVDGNGSYTSSRWEEMIDPNLSHLRRGSRSADNQSVRMGIDSLCSPKDDKRTDDKSSHLESFPFSRSHPPPPISTNERPATSGLATPLSAPIRRISSTSYSSQGQAPVTDLNASNKASAYPINTSRRRSSSPAVHIRDSQLLVRSRSRSPPRTQPVSARLPSSYQPQSARRQSIANGHSYSHPRTEARSPLHTYRTAHEVHFPASSGYATAQPNVHASSNRDHMFRSMSRYKSETEQSAYRAGFEDALDLMRDGHREDSVHLSSNSLRHSNASSSSRSTDKYLQSAEARLHVPRPHSNFTGFEGWERERRENDRLAYWGQGQDGAQHHNGPHSTPRADEYPSSYSMPANSSSQAHYSHYQNGVSPIRPASLLSDSHSSTGKNRKGRTGERQAISCNMCRQRKSKCDGSPPYPCGPCTKKNTEGSCTYATFVRRRGPAKKTKDEGSNDEEDSPTGGLLITRRPKDMAYRMEEQGGREESKRQRRSE